MNSKQFLNDPENCIEESLKGYMRLYPQLKYHTDCNCIYYEPSENEKRNIAIIATSGSGHEPFPEGYVGVGMLNAAIVGRIFTLPSTLQIYMAIHLILKTYQDGVILIAPSYSGALITIELALERLQEENVKVKLIIANDDFGQFVRNKKNFDIADMSRSLSGIIFLCKFAGAMSAAGKSLDAIYELLLSVNQNLSTIGVTLSPPSILGKNEVSTLGPDEMYLGTGICCESGTKKMPYQSTTQIVENLLDAILRQKGGSGKIDGWFTDTFVVLVNNSGGVSKLEENIVVEAVFNYLESQGAIVFRVYAQKFVTTLNAVGIHVTLLSLPKKQPCRWFKYLDAFTDAPFWPGTTNSIRKSLKSDIVIEDDADLISFDRQMGQKFPDLKYATILKECLKAAAHSLIEQEAKINSLDSQCGDGDCGSTLKLLCESILNAKNIDYQYPVSVFTELGQMAEDHMGGTSGALYGIFFMGLSSELQKADNIIDHINWSIALNNGVFSMMKYSPASLGDRTLLDALIPACIHFENNTDKDLKAALITAQEAAKIGCDITKDLKPKVGRASYVDPKLITDVDAGAYAITIIVDAIMEVFNRSDF